MHQSQNNYYKQVTKVIPQVVAQVTPQVDDLIRQIKSGVSFMRDELQEMMELKDRKNFTKMSLNLNCSFYLHIQCDDGRFFAN